VTITVAHKHMEIILPVNVTGPRSLVYPKDLLGMFTMPVEVVVSIL
jgi:hypothetical protein